MSMHRSDHRPSRPSGLIALLLALLVVMPLPAMAAGETPGRGRPATVAPAAQGPFDPRDKGLSHDVFAFFLPSYRRHLLDQADWSALSTVAYFGLVARPGGNLGRKTDGRPDFRWTAWDSPLMDRVIAKAHATGTNVILTVARFAWTSQGAAASTRLLESDKARAKLAREIKAEVARRGIDGINLDFEPIPGGQRANFVKLVREVRTRLDEIRPGLDLTVSTTGYVANYDVAGIIGPGGADAIFIMAYHYNGAWSTRAGSVAPLTRRTYDVTDTVDTYLRDARPDQIILGVPYYGYIWSTESSAAHARTRPISARWGYPSSVVHGTATRLARQYGRRWDPVEQGPWARWQARACASCPLTWRQLYYEDAESAARKYELVKREGLRGSGIWTLGYEGTDRSMERAILDAYRID
jgi:spore germination protein YaaH